MMQLVDNFIKDYIVRAAGENGKSVKSYYEDSKYNYVILEGHSVITWDNDYPVIYGSKEDAIDELKEWGTNIRNISIITERELLDCHCANEVKTAIEEEEKENADSDEVMLTYFMNPYNQHSKELVLKINRLWKKDKSRFRPILVALYDRDLKEIYDADSFMGLPIGEDNAFAELQTNWEEHAYNYLMHIADDGDLETIITFIRDRELA